MKSALLTQQCAVTAFGEGFYCRVLQEGQRVMIHFDTFDIAHNGRNVCRFFFKYSTGNIQILTPHQFALRQSVYGQTCKFICKKKTQDPFV